jgi:hypothetical protein
VNPRVAVVAPPQSCTKNHPSSMRAENTDVR